MKKESMWGVGLANGIILTMFGIAAVFWPGITTLTLLYLFAGLVLASGIVNIFSGIFGIHRGESMWFLKILLSFIEIGVGIYLLRHPKITFATFILLIGFTLIFRGVFGIVAAFTERIPASARTLLAIVGGLSLLAGIIVLFQPAASGVAFVWIIGLYALISGPVTIAMAIDSRNQQDK